MRPADMPERQAVTPEVAGSSPVVPAKFHFCFSEFEPCERGLRASPVGLPRGIARTP